MIILGIAAGKYMELPVSNTQTAYILLALLFLAALLRRWGRVASVLVVVSFFVLGVFLMKSSEGSYGRYVPFLDDAVSVMGEVRKDLAARYAEHGLEGKTYDIVAAMTLGEKKGIDKETRKVFSASGGAHILALSGMHLSILFMLISFLLPTRRFPKLSVAVEVIAVWAFVMLVGFHPSVTRAAVMLTVYCVARMMSRNTRSMDVLLFSAMLLLVISPQWLFDVGFQMSFAAMAGILMLYGPICRFLTYRREDDLPPSVWVVFFRVCYNCIVGVAVISFTAQLGVAPLVAHYFGNFPTYFLLTNFIVTPAAFLIIILAAGLLAGIPLQAQLSAVVQGMSASLQWITNLPCSSLEYRLSAWQTVLVYVIIIAVCRLVALCVRKTDRFLRVMP
jgi:competence protein ComEC